jgi:hypothetical protein
VKTEIALIWREVKFSDIKFNGSPSSSSQVVSCIQMDSELQRCTAGFCMYIKSVGITIYLNLFHFRCLEESKWNVKKALTMFTELYKISKIPPEAFSTM